MLNWLKRLGSTSPPALTGDKPRAPETPSAEPEQPPPEVDPKGRLTELLKRGNRYLDEGRHQEAAICYRQEIARSPSSVLAYVNLGFVLREMGQLNEASQQLEQALKLDSEQVDALFLLGLKMQADGNLDGALEYLLRCHDKHPTYEHAVAPLCNILMTRKEFARAQSVAQRALRLASTATASVHCALGSALAGQDRPGEALKCYQDALRLAPSDAHAWHQQGVAFHSLQRLGEARSSLEHAVNLDPDSASVHTDLGLVLFAMRQTEQALMHLNRALEIAPKFVLALGNRGVALSALGRYPEAVLTYEKLLAIAPDYPLALGNLLWNRLRTCNWQDYEESVTQIRDAVSEHKYVMDPWTLLMVCDSAPLQLQCSRLFASKRYPAASKPMASKRIGKRGKIRVAYLSADFHNHATSYLMAEMFEKHDDRRFSTYAFSFGPKTSDEMRHRLVRSFEQFLDVGDKSNEEIARLLCDLDIDIAVDLKGYTQDARPGILAHRAAPIQVSYLGFPGTMGADYIDYLLADPLVVPPSEHNSYSEKIAYLPGSYQVNDSKRRVAQATPTRAQVGLPEHGFVFCCFNNNFKITPAVFDIWMDLLRNVKDSTLWLLGDNPGVVENLRSEAFKRAVLPDRLVFAPRIPIELHMARQRLADLLLDTLPCNAHTTASDALWVGLPVLSCVGTCFAGRVGASLLSAVGLSDLAVPDLAAYRAKALWLASHPAELQGIRSRLVEQRQNLSLFDGRQFTVQLEAAYEHMVQRAQDGLAPASFSVPVRTATD